VSALVLLEWQFQRMVVRVVINREIVGNKSLKKLGIKYAKTPKDIYIVLCL